MKQILQSYYIRRNTAVRTKFNSFYWPGEEKTFVICYICAKAPDKMKTTVSVFAAFFFISVLSVSCQGDPGDFNTTFSEIEKLMNT